MDLYLIAILIFIIVIPVIIIWIMWTAVIGAGFEPTSKRKVKEMLEMVKISPQDIVYDLGSGDGRIVFEAVKKYDARAVGIEADPIRFLWSRMYLFFYRLQNRCQIKWGNFFNHNIGEATVVTLFLGDRANQQLKEKLVTELKPGTRVISYVWTFDGWEPTRVNYKDRIYLYTIGESEKNL